jgi:hypothetical protein
MHNFQSSLVLIHSHTLFRLISTGNKRLWEELISYFPFIWHNLHRKRRLQQFFVVAATCLPGYCLATIGGYTYGHWLMGAIYEVCHWDGFRCHDIQPGFIKISQKLIQGIHEHRQAGDCINLLLLFQNKDSRLKMGINFNLNNPHLYQHSPYQWWDLEQTLEAYTLKIKNSSTVALHTRISWTTIWIHCLKPSISIVVLKCQIFGINLYSRD